MKTVLFTIIMLMSFTQESKAGVKDFITQKSKAGLDFLFGGFLDEASEVEVSTNTPPTLKKEQTAQTGRVLDKQTGEWVRKKVTQNFDVRDKAGQKLKCDQTDEFPLCERTNPDTGKLEYYRFMPYARAGKNATRIEVDRKDGGVTPIQLTLVDSSTTIPGASPFDGIHFDETSNSYVDGPKPVEEKAEVAEASIKIDSAILTSNPKVEELGNSVVTNTTLAPETEVSDKPLQPLVVEAERDQVPEPSTAGSQAMKKRGLWVKNFTQKTLTMIAHRPGMEDLDLGMLVSGMEVFLPAPQGNLVSLTFKGGWFFKRDLQQRFDEGSVTEVHSLAVRD